MTTTAIHLRNEPEGPLTEQIYRRLENEIIDGRLGPGDRLNEKQLAEQQGTSRGPVREACRRLEQGGLVEFRQNRGFFVRVLDLAEVLEIYDVRAALFGQAGRILARRITMAQIEELEDLDRQMNDAVQSGDADLFYVLNRQFHARIMAFTGNRHLASIYEGLDRELHIWRKRALILDGNVRASADEHSEILRELRGGNPSRLARILRDHSLAGRNRLLRTMPDRTADAEDIWGDD